MSTAVVAAPGPVEPEQCVTQGGASARSVSASAWVVIVIVAWAWLVVAGVSPEAATFGLGGAAGLGLRIAACLAGRHGGLND